MNWLRSLFTAGRPPAESAPQHRDLTLVYRGPATLPGCPEAVAGVLENVGLTPQFVGPKERLPLNADTLQRALLYAQPGGGEVEAAWRRLRPHGALVRDYVARGGNYLGFCLGAYLASDDPGFGFLSSGTDQYIATKGASVTDTTSCVLTVDWAGTPTPMYFQDGCYLALDNERAAEVVARYDNGRIAAAVLDYGQGKVALAGPHPEATIDWFVDDGLDVPDQLPLTCATDLVQRLLRGAAAVDECATSHPLT